MRSFTLRRLETHASLECGCYFSSLKEVYKRTRAMKLRAMGTTAQKTDCQDTILLGEDRELTDHPYCTASSDVGMIRSTLWF